MKTSFPLWCRLVLRSGRRALRGRVGVAAVLLGVAGGAIDAFGAADFLPPEKAFAFSTQAVDASTVRLHWDIAPGYHLYRDRLTVESGTSAVTLAPLSLPPGREQFDANFNKNMVVYEGALDVDLHLLAAAGAGSAASTAAPAVATASTSAPTTAPTIVPTIAPITVGWQGCADAGLCYAPQTDTVQVSLAPSAGQAPNGADVLPSSRQSPSRQSPSAFSATDSIATTLASGSWLHTVGVFLLAGLLLAFTPCVLPMVPILSSLIAGQTGPVGRMRGLRLSMAYSFGMALVYAGFGVAAGLAGEGLAAALQNPWVLGGFALMLSAMSMSMFGWYELQLPSGLQSRASEWSNRFEGGSMVGVFVMGGISALVVGPCVAAPLAGALVYISQTRDVWLGGSALFAMAMGMSVPLLLVGVSAGSLLPRAGAWMEHVKHVFGMMLLAVAIWMVSPVLAPALHLLLWAAWLLAGAALLGVFDTAAGHAPNHRHGHHAVATKAAGWGVLSMAVMLAVGAASGGQSVLQPLAHLRPNVAAGTGSGAGNGAGAGGTGAGPQQHSSALVFERVASVDALDAAVRRAQQKGQAVMLDFYADWCVSCKEYDSFTFSDRAVQARLSGATLLQADVTANTAQDKALMKRFGLFGPPGIVFFDGKPPGDAVAADVPPQPVFKVVGYQNATEFLASLDVGLPK